ncbi:aminoglycoside resistance protein [Mycolicibacterium sp. BiH015]|uniref:aminoglycoside phosphotransferase family protein n=1 Tax=Mycolicibacterium sp. BiH015 TaxID=3018808 RepID=UPI0022DEF10C|nr:aminoglycoside phosphotransferase family protein [Mycolicibacterium sp. BiH015]MDA2893973.1 aminoglycoside resistance protein [Mycolicibacterium sp. BiH015]
MTSEEPANTVRQLLESWRLRTDGPAHNGTHAHLLPVRTDDGAAAVLRIGRAGQAPEHDHLVLRRWGGHGAVRLLRADPHQRAVLLERLTLPSLETLPDAEACTIVAGLYPRLHVPAMPQMASLTSLVQQRTIELEHLPRGAPIPHRLVEQAAALSRELTSEPTTAAVVLHGDLHYRHVLSARRGPWLAISPRPLNGDPHFELAPMLWHRWDDLSGDVRDGVRRRFYRLVDAAALDEDRARAWTLIRVIHAAVSELHSPRGDLTTALTRYVAIAKAVQD